MSREKKYILWFEDIRAKDVLLVGGKNASLGEMIRELTKKGINIPDGFATTAKAYWHFLEKAELKSKIKQILKDLDISNVKNLQGRGKRLRNLILAAKLPEDLEKEIKRAYQKLSAKYGNDTDVAVRSSATAEDLLTASFAGQMETFLNIRGEEKLLEAVKKCIASLFTNRAISYRQKLGFSHLKVALSVGVQKMVRSDLSSSGVMFTLDTETGFPNVVLINSSYGLGEMVVQGRVIPDEFYVFKPTLKQGFKPIIVKTLGTKKRKLVYGEVGTIQKPVPQKEAGKFTLSEEEILTLAKWAILIEEHYSQRAGQWRPMDIEWAKDGKTGELFVVQARPETVHVQKKAALLKEYVLKEKRPKILLKGIGVGEKIEAGRVRVIKALKKISQFREGEVLVTTMTNPDWEPIMKKAAAIITDSGGRTSHAAIVSRELGIACVVGTERATSVLKNDQFITVDCSGGAEGKIYKGRIRWLEKKYNLKKIPQTKTKVMVNIGSPETAFRSGLLPHKGVGLAREEFIIASKIQVHPLALINYNKLKKGLRKKIDRLTTGYKDKKQFFIHELARGIGQLGAAFWPEPVIVRFSDFKTNEYATLLGGEQFEPKEENPMLGWRGASRYIDPKFEPAFGLECQAIKKAREEFGLKNIKTMIPFCRTVKEGKKVLSLMEKYGLKQGREGLEVYVMCEIPSNVILADEFLKYFDGFSIGTNDLTQLILGIDRDNAQVAKAGDERNEAVKEEVARVIKEANKRKKYSGICGQAPSDYPDFAAFLVRAGIKSISVTPDTVLRTILVVAKEEKNLYNEKRKK